MEVQGSKPPRPGRRSVGRLSLRTKILLITGLTGGLVATLLSVVFTVQMRDALRGELGSRARVVSIQLASNLAAATSARSQVTLQQAADATLRDVGEVAYVVVRDAQGEVLAVAADKSYSGADKVEASPLAQAVEREVTVAGRQVLETSSPILFGTAEDPRQPSAPDSRTRVGTVQVGIQMDSLTHSVSAGVFRAALIGLAALALSLRSQ